MKQRFAYAGVTLLVEEELARELHNWLLALNIIGQPGTAKIPGYAPGVEVATETRFYFVPNTPWSFTQLGDSRPAAPNTDSATTIIRGWVTDHIDAHDAVRDQIGYQYA